VALGELAQIKDEELAVTGTVLGAECLVRLGEHRFAAEVLQTLLGRNPDLKAAHRWLAAIYIDLHSPNEAIAHLREWGRLDARNGRPYRWVGWFLSKDQGKLDEAIEAYREACRRDLEPALRVEVVNELAEALVNGPADYQAALDTLDQCPQTLSQPQMLILRARCLSNLAMQTEALSLLESVLRIHPELPAALELRAKMFLSAGEPQAAVPLLETALKVDAHDQANRQLLMQAYQQVGDKARAEQQRQLLEETRAYNDQLTKLHDAAARHPWDADVREQLADLCRKLNRQAEADMWRRAALAGTRNQPAETNFEQSLLQPERN
jgi:tetratricopeptide (TPR) repeat protein